METIGERIKNARKNLGYTQESLANMLYFSDKTISSWEKNRTKPDIASLCLLSEKLNTSIDYLLYGNKKVINQEIEIKIKVNYDEYLRILNDVKNKKNFFSKFQFKTNLCKYASSIDEVIFNDSINIPSIGTIKLFNKRDYDQVEQFKSIIVYRTIDDKYFVNILFKKKENKITKELDPNNSIGLDYSSPNFYVDSNGETPYKPVIIKKYDKQIMKLQSKLKESEDDEKLHHKFSIEYANLYNDIKNERKDFIHKTSTKLANQYDYVFVENIDLAKIATHRNLGKATNDNAYGKFLKVLDYKMNDRGKKLIRIDKFYPSSQICNNCGYTYQDLTLKQRKWICPECGVLLDRDINAAINIRNRGIQLVNKRTAGQSASYFA